MNRNNANYKRVRLALELTEREVQEICALGGLIVARDRVARWARNSDAGAGRYSAMRDEEFDAFCQGLADWMREKQ